jgi:hypothetical protein
MFIKFTQKTQIFLVSSPPVSKISYIPKSVGSKVIQFTAFLACINNHRVLFREYYMKNAHGQRLKKKGLGVVPDWIYSR